MLGNLKYQTINIPGGRIRKDALHASHYEYYLTDHLGNVRVTFTENENTGEAIIIQEDHYYPFGMRMNGLHCENTNLLNKYLYNGKEQQEQTLYYDYGFRQYDAQLGRWHVVDAMAEKYLSTSPYAYVMNNPINHIDVMGLYRGGGNQWISYPRPYLDSNSSRVGGEGMNFRNNTPGAILGLNSAHKNMRGVGPTRKDHDDWVAAGKPFGDFGVWYKKQNDAAWKAHFSSRQEAIAAGYSFSKLKWKRVEENSITLFNKWFKKGDGRITEVIVKEVAYYEFNYTGRDLSEDLSFGSPDRTNFWGAGGSSSGGNNMRKIKRYWQEGGEIVWGQSWSNPFAENNRAKHTYGSQDEGLLDHLVDGNSKEKTILEMYTYTQGNAEIIDIITDNDIWDSIYWYKENNVKKGLYFKDSSVCYYRYINRMNFWELDSTGHIQP